MKLCVGTHNDALRIGKKDPCVIVAFAIVRGNSANHCHLCQCRRHKRIAVGTRLTGLPDKPNKVACVMTDNDEEEDNHRKDCRRWLT
jgi:hypothetical protein